MARTLGTTTDILTSRIRQSGNIGVTNDFAVQVLTTAQQYINILLKRVITTESLTTLKEKQVYSIADDLTNAIDIVSVSESNRELFHCKDFSELSAYEENWFRNITATRFEAWHQIARDYFIIYPAKAANSSVSVEFVKATTISTDYTTDSGNNLELPDEDVEAVLKLSEIILLVRGRNFTPIKKTARSLIDILEAKGVIFKSANLNTMFNFGA